MKQHFSWSKLFFIDHSMDDNKVGWRLINSSCSWKALYKEHTTWTINFKTGFIVIGGVDDDSAAIEGYGWNEDRKYICGKDIPEEDKT